MTVKLKTIGEITNPVEIAIHEVDEELHLLFGAEIIAVAEVTFDNQRWLVQLQQREFEDEEFYEGFYVTNKNEALDALFDLGTFYKLAKEGKL